MAIDSDDQAFPGSGLGDDLPGMSYREWLAGIIVASRYGDSKGPAYDHGPGYDHSGVLVDACVRLADQLILRLNKNT